LIALKRWYNRID